MKDIHFKKFNYASVELNVLTESCNPKQNHHNMITVNDGTRNYQVIVREVGILVDEEVFDPSSR